MLCPCCSRLHLLLCVVSTMSTVQLARAGGASRIQLVAPGKDLSTASHQKLPFRATHPVRPLKLGTGKHKAKENPCRRQILEHAPGAGQDWRLSAVPHTSMGTAEQRQRIPPGVMGAGCSPSLCWLEKRQITNSWFPLENAHWNFLIQWKSRKPRAVQS